MTQSPSRSDEVLLLAQAVLAYAESALARDVLPLEMAVKLASAIVSETARPNEWACAKFVTCYTWCGDEKKCPARYRELGPLPSPKPGMEFPPRDDKNGGGWKLVPTEPTKAMRDAAHRCQWLDKQEQLQEEVVWRAMLNAAPPAYGQKIEKLRALVNQIYNEPAHIHEPAVSVAIGRDQIADEIRAILDSTDIDQTSSTRSATPRAMDLLKEARPYLDLIAPSVSKERPLVTVTTKCDAEALAKRIDDFIGGKA